MRKKPNTHSKTSAQSVNNFTVIHVQTFCSFATLTTTRDKIPHPLVKDVYITFDPSHIMITPFNAKGIKPNKDHGSGH